MSLEFEFVVKDPRWDIDQLSEVGARSAFVLSDHLIFPDMASAVVMVCSDLTIAELNKNFRGKPQPTNVLSWPSTELASRIAGRAPLLPVEAELGDIAMAFESCISELTLPTFQLWIMSHICLYMLPCISLVMIT